MNEALMASFFKSVGYTPFREQWDYHVSPARFRFSACGRRYGKSTMAARDVTPKHLLAKDKLVWAVGPTYDLGEKEFRIVWNDLIVKKGFGRDKRVRKAYNKRSGDMYIQFPWNTRFEVRALAIDTPIPTPSGWTTMHALRVGDWVFDNRGQPTQVTAATEVMLGHDCYEVVFSDGTSLVTDAGHQWLSHTAKSRYKKRPPEVVTTEQMSMTLERKQWPGVRNHAVPLSLPVEYPEKKLSIDPYVFGAWLGDGTTTKNQITCHSEDEEIVQEFARLGYRTYPLPNAGLYCWGFDLPAGSYKAGSWLYRKQLTAEYLEGSVEQRLALLQGLMDTDGGNENHHEVSFSNCNMQLIEAVETLVASLGWTSYRTCGKANGSSRKQDNYRVHFHPTLPVFKLGRKLRQQMLATSRRSPYRFVKSVERVESVPVKCIQVDSPSHLYLAGKDYIVTHNSAEHPDLLVGEALDHVIMCEAAKHKKETWDRFIRPSLADKRGSADFPSTPEGFNWFYESWQLGRDPDFKDYESWKFPSWYNTKIYPGGRMDPEIVLLEKTMTGEWFQQEIGADFSSFVGKIFPEWDEFVHVKPHTYNPAWKNYIAFDWGYTNPLAAVEFQVSPSDQIFVWRVYYQSYKTVKDVAEYLKAQNQPEGYHIDLCFGDPADPEAVETMTREMSKHYPNQGIGVWAPQTLKTDYTWRDGIDLMRQFMKADREISQDEYGTPQYEPSFFVDPGCRVVTKEFSNYRSKAPVKGANVPEFGNKVEDHTIDALRYALLCIFKIGCQNRLADVMNMPELSLQAATRRLADAAVNDSALNGLVSGGPSVLEGAAFSDAGGTFNMGQDF